MNNDKNILLNQIILDNSSFTFKEIIPHYEYSEAMQSLVRDKNGNILWAEISNELNQNILVNNRLKDTDIYYDNGRIGLGRKPLFNYRFDLSIPKDVLMTGFHIGDGSYGFSLGNGANQGFIPEIIGIGSDENDAGLYFVGIAGNDKPSNIPLIVIDGRNTFGKKLNNRPILGITSGNYEKYIISLDENGNLNIEGNVSVKDMKINGISINETLNNLQTQINELKTKIT